MQDVPGQVTSLSELEILESLQDSQEAAKDTTIISFATAWLLGSSLVLIWNMINVIQLAS